MTCARVGPQGRDPLTHLAHGAGHQEFVRGAQVGAPPDPGSAVAAQECAVPSSKTTAEPDIPFSCSFRPVVISTGSPTSFSGMRWRAVSAWIAVTPG